MIKLRDDGTFHYATMDDAELVHEFDPVTDLRLQRYPDADPERRFGLTLEDSEHDITVVLMLDRELLEDFISAAQLALQDDA